MTAAARRATPNRTPGLLLLALVCAFSFGAIVRVAVADVSYHTMCAGHGFVQGGSLSDGSFFARVDAGCGSTLRNCYLYTYGSYIGGQTVTGPSTTCNAWSRDFGDYTECASTAHVESAGVFSDHVHKAANWCG